APGLEDATELHALRRVLASPWLRAQLAAIPGYDVSPLAEHGALPELRPETDDRARRRGRPPT
ncbi:MAG: hypothetical protein M0Z33_05025, partial [Actinomycetota bacterium]|nr:hypothetical protein [Actinomycetota bacterium]